MSIGWTCPGCGRCYSPRVDECYACNPRPTSGMPIDTTFSLSWSRDDGKEHKIIPLVHTKPPSSAFSLWAGERDTPCTEESPKQKLVEASASRPARILSFEASSRLANSATIRDQ